QRVQSAYEDEPESAKKRRGSFTLSLNFEPEEGESFTAVQSGDSAAFIAAQGRYRVFTRRYDKQIEASSLLRPALLLEYRQLLDQRLAEQGMNVAKLARGLRAVLARPQRDGWRFG